MPNPFAKYDAAAREYGYEVADDGALKRGEKILRTTIAEKKGRLHVRDSSGSLLFSGPAEGRALGAFLESFYFAVAK